MEKLYTATSDKYMKKSLVIPKISHHLKGIVDIFKQHGWMGDIEYAEKLLEPIKIAFNDDKTIIVCFSGGKDSIAVAKHYINAGYKVYLYHMRHINFALTDEYLIAQEFAEEYNLPLFIDSIKLSGHNDYVEHPMKNMIIANGALQYGIREGITTNIAFGNYRTSTLQEDNFEFCAGDDKEMWALYEKAIQTIIPNFKIHLVLDNLNDTLEAVCSDRKLLDISVSCLGRANLRQHKHDWVLKRFGINLPKHRCGQCYKCCVEYIYMTDHNLQEYSPEYYEYCMKKLKQNLDMEDNMSYNINEVFKHYFFYSMKESKYYGQHRES